MEEDEEIISAAEKGLSISATQIYGFLMFLFSAVFLDLVAF